MLTRLCVLQYWCKRNQIADKTTNRAYVCQSFSFFSLYVCVQHMKYGTVSSRAILSTNFVWSMEHSTTRGNEKLAACFFLSLFLTFINIVPNSAKLLLFFSLTDSSIVWWNVSCLRALARSPSCIHILSYAAACLTSIYFSLCRAMLSLAQIFRIFPLFWVMYACTRSLCWNICLQKCMSTTGAKNGIKRSNNEKNGETDRQTKREWEKTSQGISLPHQIASDW